MEESLSGKKVNIILNGTKTLCDKGETIFNVAKKAGVVIPTLCHDIRLEPYGACRMCSVEVKGVPRLLPACSTPVSPS